MSGCSARVGEGRLSGTHPIKPCGLWQAAEQEAKVLRSVPLGMVEVQMVRGHCQPLPQLAGPQWGQGPELLCSAEAEGSSWSQLLLSWLSGRVQNASLLSVDLW